MLLPPLFPFNLCTVSATLLRRRIPNSGKLPPPRTFLLLAALGIFSFLGACSKRPKDVDFIFINGPEPKSLDPAVITGQSDGRLAWNLFEGLTTRDEFGKVVPGVAERWEVSPDGKTYTFHLRNNAKWSNGDPVTAADFLGSWKRILEPATACPYAEILFFIRGAESYNKGELKDFSRVGVKAVDAQTLQVELNDPVLYFPEVVAFTTYLPAHLPTVEKYGEQWIMPRNIVCNGPYMLKDWKINDRVELVKNPLYWRADTVAFNRVDALAISNATTALNVYSTGGADLIIDKSLIPPMLIKDLRQRPDFHTYTFLANYFYRFNVTRAPLNKVLVRKALTASINRGEIVERLTRAGELPASSFTPPGLTGYLPPDGISYDPEQARRWLAEAGYPGGKNFPRLSILYNKTDLNEQIAVEIQAMWRRELGIFVELRNQEWASYLDSLDHLDYDIARSSWVGDYPDPNTFLGCFISGRGNNRTGWSNKSYDSLMGEANRQLDPVKRFELFQKAETILVRDEAPIAPIYFFAGIMFYDGNRLGGLAGTLVDDHPVRTMYWKDPKKEARP